MCTPHTQNRGRGTVGMIQYYPTNSGGYMCDVCVHPAMERECRSALHRAHRARAEVGRSLGRVLHNLFRQGRGDPRGLHAGPLHCKDLIPRGLMVAAAYTPCHGGRSTTGKGPPLSQPKKKERKEARKGGGDTQRSEAGDSARTMGKVRRSMGHSR